MLSVETPEYVKQADVTSMPETREVQVVRWTSRSGIPQKKTYRHRTSALKKAAQLESHGILCQVYAAEVGEWRRLPL